MHLVQILLPRWDRWGVALPPGLYSDVCEELAQRFGGVTCYGRAPGQGLWRDDEGRVQRDDVVVIEIMLEQPDEAFWRGYRSELEKRFKQKELVVRALPMVRL
ncbi:MAG TPA: hypothetical protein VEC14_16615 [Reyranellaceae bacterium]|nr:hypothetical protein [Reyranellaceae bacterium]